MDIIIELAAIVLTIIWMAEIVRDHRRAKQTKLAHRTLELIASDKARTRAGCYEVRWQ